MTKLNFLLATTFAALVAAKSAAGQSIDKQSLFTLDFEFHDQTGRTRKLSDFKDQPIALAMFYTHCQTVCPLTVKHLQAIERQASLSLRKKLQFVLVSLDYEHETTQSLQAFIKTHQLNSARWSLLRGDENVIRSLAAALDLRFKRASGGEIDHTSGVYVLNGKGVLAFSDNDLASDGKETASRLERL